VKARYARCTDSRTDIAIFGGQQIVAASTLSPETHDATVLGYVLTKPCDGPIPNRILKDIHLCKDTGFAHSSVRGSDMGDSARRAQHYHDLALEFLVLTKIRTAIDIRENYRMMGQHYLAKARAELAHAQKMASATDLEIAPAALPQS